MPRQSTQTQEKKRQQPQPGQDTRANPRSCEKDSVVGAEYLTRTDPDEAMIRFKDKPSQAVLGFMKDNGFRWSRKDQAWTRPMGTKTAGQDDAAARRTYGEVVDMLRRQNGLAPSQDVDESIRY